MLQYHWRQDESLYRIIARSANFYNSIQERDRRSDGVEVQRGITLVTKFCLRGANVRPTLGGYEKLMGAIPYPGSLLVSNAVIVQLGEQPPCKWQVVGSIPAHCYGVKSASYSFGQERNRRDQMGCKSDPWPLYLNLTFIW